ncbi:MAG TPA: hypothetical protein EYN27_11505 [Rhodospirillales bacterium]|nr:hypothetical protein [Rhodospirillales bacterium]
MDDFINKYRVWVWNIPEPMGDIIACVGYMTWCGSLAGALLAVEVGALVPTLVCLGIAGVISLSAYIY